MNDEKIKIILDQKITFEDKKDDNTIGEEEIERLRNNQEAIGKRSREINKLGILYASDSVKLFIQAKQLYILGLFESSIMVCRSAVEYIATEIFWEKIKVFGDLTTEVFILDNIDFRKIVNKYLIKQKIINENDAKYFNIIYDIGNKYIHPKIITRNPEIDSKQALDLLSKLIGSLKNVLNDYNLIDGQFQKK